MGQYDDDETFYIKLIQQQIICQWALLSFFWIPKSAPSVETVRSEEDMALKYERIQTQKFFLLFLVLFLVQTTIAPLVLTFLKASDQKLLPSYWMGTLTWSFLCLDFLKFLKELGIYLRNVYLESTYCI